MSTTPFCWPEHMLHFMHSCIYSLCAKLLICSLHSECHTVHYIRSQTKKNIFRHSSRQYWAHYVSFTHIIIQSLMKKVNQKNQKKKSEYLLEIWLTLDLMFWFPFGTETVWLPTIYKKTFYTYAVVHTVHVQPDFSKRLSYDIFDKLWGQT